MVKSREDFSDADLEKILKQAEQIEFERLQHRTTIPTVFIKELLDSPPNFLLSRNFFDVGYKDRKKISIIHELIEKIENIAIEECKELLEEQDYRVDFEQEEPIMYSGFPVGIIVDHKDIYLESKELKCLNFFKLCQCINLKAFAKLYFENQQYEVSFYCINLAGYVFGAGTNEVSGDNDFQKKIAKRNRQNSINYWQPRNEEKEKLKAKYLRIMNEQGFTKYTDAADYIYANENIEKKKYRYVYDALRAADK